MTTEERIRFLEAELANLREAYDAAHAERGAFQSHAEHLCGVLGFTQEQQDWFMSHSVNIERFDDGTQAWRADLFDDEDEDPFEGPCLVAAEYGRTPKAALARLMKENPVTDPHEEKTCFVEEVTAARARQEG